MGDWEGKHFHPEEIEVDPELAKLTFTDPWKFGGCPGGETYRGLISRCGYFLKELIARDDDKTYLISTHGVALRAMLNFLYDDPEDFWHGHVPYNCAVNIVEAKGGIAKLIADDRIYYSQEDVIDRFAVE
jgi:broad specificity phosphatase PhoE